MRFRVVWEIDIEAGDARKAAKQAQMIQQDKESTASCFTVYGYSEKTGVTFEHIDLEEEVED